LSNPVNRQTNRQTDTGENITSLAQVTMKYRERERERERQRQRQRQRDRLRLPVNRGV